MSISHYAFAFKTNIFVHLKKLSYILIILKKKLRILYVRGIITRFEFLIYLQKREIYKNERKYSMN